MNDSFMVEMKKRSNSLFSWKPRSFVTVLSPMTLKCANSSRKSLELKSRVRSKNGANCAGIVVGMPTILVTTSIFDRYLIAIMRFEGALTLHNHFQRFVTLGQDLETMITIWS